MMQTLEYYLPTWNQVVKGYTPGESGVRMIPTFVAQMLASVISGYIGELKCQHL